VSCTSRLLVMWLVLGLAWLGKVRHELGEDLAEKDNHFRWLSLARKARHELGEELGSAGLGEVWRELGYRVVSNGNPIFL